MAPRSAPEHPERDGDEQAGGQAVNADANAGGTASKAELRTLAQRERILCAAQKCFVEHGFHAASMASIAETAEMRAAIGRAAGRGRGCPEGWNQGVDVILK